MKFWTLLVRAPLVALLLIGCVYSFAQSFPPPVTWSFQIRHNASVSSGTRLEGQIKATILDGWHIYSMSQHEGGPRATAVSLPKGEWIELNGVIAASKPETVYDRNFGMQTEIYKGKVEFDLPLEVLSPSPNPHPTLTVQVLFQACSERVCLPPKTIDLTATLGAAAGHPKLSATSDSGPRAATNVPPPSAGAPTAIQSTTPSSDNAPRNPPRVANAPAATTNSRDLRSFLVLAFVTGGLSLLTPCVFPMIPITVSYFVKHSGKTRREAIANSALYAAGIIVTFSGMGTLLALAFGAAGINRLATSPWMNLLITVVFVSFAFSLMGFFSLGLPPSLVSRIDGLSRNGGSTWLAIPVMSFTFTLTSFTCTVPFVGSLLVLASRGDYRWPILGLVVFSSVFAAPFFVLSLVPQVLTLLPKSGGWLNSVKVAMGLLELAAATKFLSNADLIWGWGIFTRQVVLASWIAIVGILLLYALGVVSFAPSRQETKTLNVARLTFAIITFSVVTYLVPGLFGRSLGGLEPFLPPDATVSEADWIVNDYGKAVEKAKTENKPLFVNFTGYTCTNCRWMETNMFSRPAVQIELQKYVKVKLYTDGSGKLFEQNMELEQTRYGTVALPLYVVQNPSIAGDTTDAVFSGLTRDEAEFLRFVR